MITKAPSLRVYHATLLDYLLGSGESGLADAYELGRTGMDAGCSLSHMVQLHEKAVNAILESTPAASDIPRRIRASSKFLLEALSPYDMAWHAYRETLQAPRPGRDRRTPRR
ncbi:MAG TPA: phosphatase RsbU N-terminal domain-containing protein [Thermoanaerobaculia bacterium]|nr:phosphatase RsbU N-terminal domain-containing protein [Thermoanaerobaculia bacterium]